MIKQTMEEVKAQQKQFMDALKKDNNGYSPDWFRGCGITIDQDVGYILSIMVHGEEDKDEVYTLLIGYGLNEIVKIDVVGEIRALEI